MPWGKLEARTQMPPRPSSPLVSGALSLLTSFCLARFFHRARNRTTGHPQAHIIRKRLHIMIPVPKPRNLSKDPDPSLGHAHLASHWCPDYRSRRKTAAPSWTTCFGWQERPFCRRRGIIEACCRCVYPFRSPGWPSGREVLNFRGLQFSHLKFWGLADVMDMNAHVVFLHFMYPSLLLLLLLSLVPSRSWHTIHGVPSLWIIDCWGSRERLEVILES